MACSGLSYNHEFMPCLGSRMPPPCSSNFAQVFLTKMGKIFKPRAACLSVLKLTWSRHRQRSPCVTRQRVTGGSRLHADFGADSRLIRTSALAMRRLLKSKSPADIPTPTPPAEVVRDLASRRDPRALAATSTAIALSLGSVLYDTNDTSGDGAGVQGKGSGWHTAYGAARIAVEIAKESSDMFLPLKAVVGAVSILIKNCDVSASCSRTEHLLTFCLFPGAANIG